MGYSPKFTITNSIAAGLTKIERARGFLDAAKLSEDWIAEMQNRALVLEAHHTTHIEGTHLTLEQSEQLLAGKKLPGADPDDTREVQERGEKVIRLDLLARKHDLNARQRLAMRHAVENEGLTLKEFAGLCKGAPRRTLQRELKELVDKGLLISQGATNRLRYVPSKELS